MFSETRFGELIFLKYEIVFRTSRHYYRLEKEGDVGGIVEKVGMGLFSMKVLEKLKNTNDASFYF